MDLICFLGRHGSGKTTVATALAKKGYKHFSIGTMRRLALNGQFPSDVPAAVMMGLQRHRPGQPLPLPLAKRIVDHALSSGMPAILDGFPSSQEHLKLLPPCTVFVVVSAPAQVRTRRLLARADISRRKWDGSRQSEREKNLPDLVRQVRKRYRTILLKNHSAELETAAMAASGLYNLLQMDCMKKAVLT